MGERGGTTRTGCGQATVIVLMLLWLGVIPAGVMLLVDAGLGGVAAPVVLAVAAIGASAAALLVPFAAVALITRRRAGWEATTATAAVLVGVVGHLVLDAVVRASFPESTHPPLDAEGLWAAALRLVLLVPYAVLAAWLVPRLAAARRRRVLAWLGLGRLDPAALMLALAVAALVTFPWPVSGALGDSLTSLSLAVQALAQTIPQVLMFWGVAFCLLTSAFARPWVAALVTTVVYALTTLSRVLPTADWGALQNSVYLLPLALLLTELRARGRGVVSLLPLAFCTHVAPLLFVDPRDALAQGIPEPQHLVAYAITVVTAAVVGPALWVERRVVLAVRDRVHLPVWVRNVAALAVVVVMWGVWGALYVFAGEPGFADDGFLIIMEEQADLSGAGDIPDREARLEMVYQTLTGTAKRTQKSLRDELDALGVPYRPYYIVNMIRVDGHRWLMGRFRGRPGVAHVIVNPNVRDYPRRIPIPYGGDSGPPEGVQANLGAIGADGAWALGADGDGIVVAGQDTGYDWTHPALKVHYRGWDGESGVHDYNWHDAWDNTAVPFDDDSHGTHTMGTVLGDDGAGNRTGVAPGARWIGCRNMRRGFGNPGAYAECMEFFLAPYFHGGDPFADGDVAMAPHVVNNSWGCPDFEGCFRDTLKPAVEALRAAGIMMVVSAGNDGPACGTASTPPANYDAVLSIGATDEDGNIVGFSSRGPVDGLIKPDVSAPGQNVRSSVPGGRYGFAGGTSMAGPHVAGLVALLWSANPLLVGDIDATEALICQTAEPRPVGNTCTTEDEVAESALVALFENPVCACGDLTGLPNNVYGCGFIDAEAAVRAALEE